jgi:hypothetical protein
LVEVARISRDSAYARCRADCPRISARRKQISPRRGFAYAQPSAREPNAFVVAGEDNGLASVDAERQHGIEQCVVPR